MTCQHAAERAQYQAQMDETRESIEAQQIRIQVLQKQLEDARAAEHSTVRFPETPIDDVFTTPRYGVAPLSSMALADTPFTLAVDLRGLTASAPLSKDKTVVPRDLPFFGKGEEFIHDTEDFVREFELAVLKHGIDCDSSWARLLPPSLPLEAQDWVTPVVYLGLHDILNH
ncbi:hypothetical protein GQ54DRAFT_299645 [Martensiomyces pterosporus]|nr:hypothetical protein GQ54DRAFT_299645 [Martensiomyces pterosporus]